MEHTEYKCDCNQLGCQFCDGGLFACTVCFSFEGATTTECPGGRMSLMESDLVYKGKLDFVNGKWVLQTSPHSPAYYRENQNDSTN